MFHRKSSDRFSAKEDQQGRMKAMYAVDVFRPQDADEMARRMIERESRGYGDQMNAYEKVADRCGMSARQLRRFLSGEIKNPGFRLLEGIRVGWIGLWQAEIKRLQRELDTQKARFGSEHFVDIEAEAEALAQRLEVALATAKGR
ncbi:hypothetical protein [Rhizobium rhizogenes]|jgi:transcriptional regulator with XRE-family HTH domain|uniref:hypothetical protein n=1 Tax=Rhizobium rhizogenes TaxID=359 RepID=UPI0015738318|nr:hypothetical protein [Rhizobium rhizogenes]NTF67944.1 hypothetical protein [Rhizobium rhizogenes]